MGVWYWVETKVATAYREQQELEVAPKASSIYPDYAILMLGEERELQKKLGLWDRFQTADGFFPSLARFAISGSIVGAALFFSATIGR